MTLNASIVPTLGLYAVPLATDWRGIAETITDIYDDRIRPAPWIPADWYSKVSAVNGAFNAEYNQRIILLPASPKTLLTYGAPAWLNDTDKRKAWADLYTETNTAYNAYIAGKREEGQRVLDRVYANAAFWERLWQLKESITNPLGDLLNTAITTGAIGVGLYLLLRPKTNPRSSRRRT